jgi:hypothetical protein
VGQRSANPVAVGSFELEAELEAELEELVEMDWELIESVGVEMDWELAESVGIEMDWELAESVGVEMDWELTESVGVEVDGVVLGGFETGAVGSAVDPGVAVGTGVACPSGPMLTGG